MTDMPHDGGTCDLPGVHHHPLFDVHEAHHDHDVQFEHPQHEDYAEAFVADNEINDFQVAWASSDRAAITTSNAELSAITCPPHDVLGPILPLPSVDPFVAIDDDTTQVAAIAGAIGAVAVGAAALDTKESRATAMATATEMVNRARDAATRLGGHQRS